MEPRIVQLAPNEFLFEYEDQKAVPRLVKGQIFVYEKVTYRIAYFSQVFGEKIYCSFLVLTTTKKSHA